MRSQASIPAKKLTAGSVRKDRIGGAQIALGTGNPGTLGCRTPGFQPASVIGGTKPICTRIGASLNFAIYSGTSSSL
jgi:hypothetical protein